MLTTIAKDNNGFVTAAQAKALGVQGARLSEAVRAGILVRVARGVYCLSDVWEDEFAIASMRFPKGVISHGSALYLHDMTDRTPERVTMTFPRGYNATSARGEGVRVKSCQASLIDLGKVELLTPSGNRVVAYDLERTLCDLLRGTASPDVQLVNPAMKAYVRSKSKDVTKLLTYAKFLGVLGKVRGYLEVLL